MSDDHFTVGWSEELAAGDEAPRGESRVSFHGQRRTIATHQSTTDPDA